MVIGLHFPSCGLFSQHSVDKDLWVQLIHQGTQERHWKVKFILAMVFKSGKFRIQETILSKRLELQEPMVLAKTVLDGNLEVEEPKCPVSLNLAVDKS